MKKYNAYKVCIIVGSFLVAIVLGFDGVSAGLVEEMVALDRDYIPALALTNQPEKPEALVKEAMSRLENAWERFLKTLTPVQKEDPILKPALKEAEKHIEEAGKMLASGRKAEAHEALEGIRRGLAKARKFMGIDYLPDRLTAFHDPMEAFYHTAYESKTLQDWTALKKGLENLSILWNEVEQHKLDTKRFGFGPEKAALYVELVKKEREILTQMAALLTPEKKEDLLKAALSLRKVFARVYLLFGDFRGLQ